MVHTNFDELVDDSRTFACEEVSELMYSSFNKAFTLFVCWVVHTNFDELVDDSRTFFLLWSFCGKIFDFCMDLRYLS